MKTKIFEEGKVYIFTDKYYKNDTIFENDLNLKQGKPLRVLIENDFSVLTKTFDGKIVELEKKMLSDEPIEKLPNKLQILFHILLFGLHKIKFWISFILFIAFMWFIAETFDITSVTFGILLFVCSKEISYVPITEKTYLLSQKKFRKELQCFLDK